MTEAEIRAVVDKFADIAAVLHDADPDDKAEIFRQLNPRLTYHPGRRLVEAEVKVPQHWQSDSVRGATAPKNQCLLAAEFALGHVA